MVPIFDVFIMYMNAHLILARFALHLAWASMTLEGITARKDIVEELGSVLENHSRPPALSEKESIAAVRVCRTVDLLLCCIGLNFGRGND